MKERSSFVQDAISGDLTRALFSWVERERGKEGMARLRTVLGADLTLVHSERWVSVSTFVELNLCVAELFSDGCDSAPIVRDVGRHLARGFLPRQVPRVTSETVHNILIEAASVVASEYRLMVSSYHRNGRNSGTITHATPFSSRPAVCDLWLGFYEHCLFACGVLAPRVVHEVDDEHHRCAYLLRWS